ncbi:MAG: HupE/UreJ family protein [Bacteroidota bacterium]
MRPLKTLAFFVFFCSSFAAFSHPDDELVIKEIEQGEMVFPDDQMVAEYEAALKRQRKRLLGAMPSLDKFVLFIKAGVRHIIPKGMDHILFVLGLFFSSLILGSLLWQVTAFTLAHTITLAIAALGIVQVPGAIVEPLIALSIVWVAVENCVFKEANKWRPFIVFGFGLLHGLGFAAVLSEYGLPEGNLVPSLLAFNIGVELGQLFILFFAALFVWFIRNKSWYRKRVQVPASLIIALVGLFWFIERIF